MKIGRSAEPDAKLSLRYYVTASLAIAREQLPSQARVESAAVMPANIHSKTALGLIVHRHRKLILLLAFVPFYGACSMMYLNFTGQVVDRDWATASHAPSGLAPDPATTHEAVIQIYAARVAEWRGYFGVHSWIAVKRTDAREYTIYEVMDKQLATTGSAVAIHSRIADGHWYGNRPTLLRDVRGTGVDELIDRIDAAARNYPHAKRYRIWPGPNSNTFVAHIARMVPQLRLDLPATAVGKDYLGVVPVARTTSGTGGQLSVIGLLGVSAGLEEGFELNVFGLTFGLDPNDVSIKLPLLGRVSGARPSPTRVLDEAEG